jgi:outer membrane biosynthesis protein TonB
MAFETFMEQSKPRPRSGRLVALIASGVGHSALLLGLAALVLRPAVKAAMPTLVPVSLRLPFSPRPAAAPPATAPAPDPPAPKVAAASSLPRVPKRRPRPAPAVAPAPAPEPPTQPSVQPTTTDSPEPPATAPAVASAVTQPPSTGPAGPPSAPSTVAPSTTPGATAPPRRPRFLPEALGATQKLSGELPRLPPALARTGESYVVLARVCVAETGQVSSVAIERSAHPAIDAQVSATVGAWRYRPLLAASVPIPFCTFVRFEFRSL